MSIAGTQSLNGLPLSYLIGADDWPGQDGRAIVVGYDADKPPNAGIGVGYCNLLDEKNRGAYPPYLISKGTAKQYKEGLIDPSGPGFDKNLKQQFGRRQAFGFPYIELDNLDSYDLAYSLEAIALAEEYSLQVIAKNVLNLKGGVQILAHPNVEGCIVEAGAGDPVEMHDLRRRAGKPALPVWFVFHSDQLVDARIAARAIEVRQLVNMGVTHSPDGEYTSVQDILLPIKDQLMTDQGAAIIAKAKSFIGRFHDGPDVPWMAREIGKIWPETAEYAKLATNATKWCGIFWAYVLSLLGIRPPYDEPFNETDDYMFAQSPLVAKWGTILSRDRVESGDTAVLPGHITFFDGDAGGGYFWGVGGNQSDGVTRTKFSWSDATFVRAPQERLPQKPAVINLRRRMARAIIDYEARRDSQGRLLVYALPPGDGGGAYEVAGINERYHPQKAAELRELIDAGRHDEAERVAADYIVEYTNVAADWTTEPGAEFFLRDCCFNRGPKGAARILQRAVGVDDDGEVGPDTRVAMARKSAMALLPALRVAREDYERNVVGYREQFWRGLINRWDKALTQAQKFSAEQSEQKPVPVAKPVEPIKSKLEECLAEINAAIRPILEKHMADTPASEPIKNVPALDDETRRQIALAVQAAIKQAAPKVVPVVWPWIQKILPSLGIVGSIAGMFLTSWMQTKGWLGPATGDAATPAAVGTYGTGFTTLAAAAVGWINQLIAGFAKK